MRSTWGAPRRLDGRQTLDQLCHCITGPALANERALNLMRPCADGNTHLLMSKLEFMPRRIELPLCGMQIHWSDVSMGSRAGLRRLNLVAEDLPVELVRHTADSWVTRILARCRYW